ncbi:BHLH domain-containing protein [Meloidogyne graminicola]|uniref:BHLH domain-containing protein n=1 Tax=Meloidogyne graminicola TaxID=189291 RepID=A0A8S9Z629_9BILA|nr:BHLH domain-containing protein [Meloidogyne graminicola]
MVKTDDYIDDELAAQTKEKFDENHQHLIGEEIREKNENLHNKNWITPPRSKSVGLAEYESDESQQKLATLDNDDDRRIRRQIANCNERRRMQSINAGFQSLRQLLPCKDGDKMSKASILAATAEFIQDLLVERNKLLGENSESAAKRRKLNFGEQNGSPTLDECIKTIEELRILLQNETHLRMKYEKELIESKNSSKITNLENFPTEIASPSTQGAVTNFFYQQPVINNTTSSVPPQTERISKILSSPLFSIASSAGANAAVVAQQALINAAAVATGKTIGGINGNNYNQQNIFHSTPIILDNKILDNSQTCYITNEQQRSQTLLENGNTINNNNNGGFNSSLSISQRLGLFVLAIRHLEGANLKIQNKFCFFIKIKNCFAFANN